MPTNASAAFRKIVLAVSGGPDSLALLVLVGENLASLEAVGVSFLVATVDHGLRPEAAREAEAVAAVAASFGMEHRTLRWDGEKPSANIQALAREARYDLLAALARETGAAAVVTAHHEDDQLETHLLALQRGAGDRGLAGMRPARRLADGVVLLRPFLGVAGVRLSGVARRHGLTAADDPGNRDARFGRVRVRQDLKDGRYDRSDLIRRIASHGARRDDENRRLAAWLSVLRTAGSLVVGPAGVIVIAATAFRAGEARLADLFLAQALRAASGSTHPPPFDAVRRLSGRLRSAGPCCLTLGGASAASDGEHIRLFREFGRKGPAAVPVSGSGQLAFDRRFLIRIPHELPEREEHRVVAFGMSGRGNAVERTLPVVVDRRERPVAGPAQLDRKLPPGAARFAMQEIVSCEFYGHILDSR